MMNKFRMTIGEWAVVDEPKVNFTVESNFSVAEVREVHFRIKEATGFDIEKICSKYAENAIDIEIYEKLSTETKFTVKYEQIAFGDHVVIEPQDMINLWLVLLRQTEPKLIINIVPELEMIHFLGKDDKGRNISSVGYGTVT